MRQQLPARPRLARRVVVAAVIGALATASFQLWRADYAAAGSVAEVSTATQSGQLGPADRDVVALAVLPHGSGAGLHGSGAGSHGSGAEPRLVAQAASSDTGVGAVVVLAALLAVVGLFAFLHGSSRRGSRSPAGGPAHRRLIQPHVLSLALAVAPEERGPRHAARRW